MSILVHDQTRVLVQNITGLEGTFHAQRMMEYGTRVVAGTAPGKGGMIHLGIPVFDTVEEAVIEEGANASAVFVPPFFAADAVIEAADSGIGVIVCITEGIPTLDMIKVKAYLRSRSSVLIGPNSPGIISPEKCKIGIMPNHICKPGSVGIISRSGTLAYEAIQQVTALGYGQSTAVGQGGDPVSGYKFTDFLRLFSKDDDTEAVILIGEIGGSEEESAAEYIRREFRKPVIGYVAGRTAPSDRRMGHAGAVISGGLGTAAEKIKALGEAGVHVVLSPADIGRTLQAVLR